MANLSHHIDDEQPVCVKVNGDTLVVSPDPVPISIKDKHRAHWFLADEGTIDAIEFDQGRHPFRAEHHVPKSKKHVLSRTVVDTKHIGQKFKYTVAVTLPNGKQVRLDPEVHVMP
jgi:hypothetical protein